MSKIVKLHTSASYYFERALDRADEEDYLGSLEFLRRAEQLVQDPFGDEALEIRLEIASTLALMGLYSESNRIYFRLTAFQYAPSDVYYGIIRNFMMMDMPQEAANYLGYAASKKIFDEDDEFEPVDYEPLARFAPSPKLRLVKSNDNSQTLSLAKRMLGSSDIDYARQMLESVPENSPQFAEAANYRALIEITDGNTSEAIRLCDKVLEKNDEDIYALTTKILALTLAGLDKERDEAIAALEAIKVTEWSQMAKIALCFCQIGDAPRAYRYLSECIDELPYDRDMVLLYALSAANEGNLRAAKNALVNLQHIHPEDAVLRYYARAVDLANGEKTNFELMVDLPQEQCEFFERFIETTIESTRDPEIFWERMVDNPELFDMVQWALCSGALPLQMRLGRFLAQSTSAYQFVRDYLVDPDYPVIPKKEMLYGIFSAEAAEVVQAVISNEIRWFHPAIPKVNHAACQRAYWQVYAALACIGQDFDEKLNVAFTALYARLKAAGELQAIDEQMVAAVLAYKSRAHKVFASKIAVCEVFGVSKDAFAKFLNRIEPKKRAKNKKEDDDGEF